MRDIALTLVFFGLLFFVLTRPYVGIYIWTWLGLMNPHRLAFGFAFHFPYAQIVAIVTLLALFASNEPKRIPWTRETILLLVFILWMLFTTFFSFYPELAWEQWGKVWKIMLMAYVSMMLINTRQKLYWLVWVIVLSLGLYGVKGGVFTILTGGSYSVQGPLGSFIYGNNEMGLALIMTIPLMRYLQLQADNMWVHRGLVVSMFLTGVAAIGTQSRGTLLGMIVMGTFLGIKSRNKVFVLLSVLAVAGAVVAIMPQQWYDRMKTIETYEQDASAAGRINAWWTAFNMAKTNVTGGGFEAFQWATFSVYAPDQDDVHDVHSIYFEVLGEHGWVGLTMFLLLAWFTWTTGNRIRRQSRASEETKWAGDLASMIQVSMIGYAAAGSFLGLAYFDLYYTLIITMVICSVLLKEQVSQAQNVADQGGTELRPLRGGYQ